MRKRAVVLAPLLLAGCGAGGPGEPLTTPVTTVRAPYDGLAIQVEKIEKDTHTEIGVALYDGTTLTQAGSLDWLPAWSTIKIPIAFAAAEHCDYSEDTVAELTEASIEWSDNDSARALWDCMGSDEEASKKVAAEIAKSGAGVKVNGAFGTTRWPFAGQARYAHMLSAMNPDNPIIADMRHIDDEQSYGLGQLGVPFKGGWSDNEADGAWHNRQFGWIGRVGVAIGARSADGDYDATVEALDTVARLLSAGTGS